MEERNKKRLDQSAVPAFHVSDESDFPASHKIELGELRVQRRPELHEGLRVGDRGHVEVRDLLGAGGQAAGDHPAHLADRHLA